MSGEIKAAANLKGQLRNPFKAIQEFKAYAYKRDAVWFTGVENSIKPSEKLRMCETNLFNPLPSPVDPEPFCRVFFNIVLNVT